MYQLKDPERSAKGLVPRVRKLLADSPSTCVEIADILHVHRRAVQLAMWVMTSTHQAESIASVPHPDEPARGRKRIKLYSLTPRGHYLAKRKRPDSNRRDRET